MHFLRALKSSRWCDLRLLVWVVAIPLLWLSANEWAPGTVQWEAWETAPLSFLVVHTAPSLLLPGLLTAIAAVGFARSLSGHSALNGAYSALCAIIVLIAGTITWNRASFRLYATQDFAQIRTHGIYFRSFERSEAVRIHLLAVRSGRGIIRHYPQVECADGRRINIHDWEFARRLAQAWEISFTPEAEKITRQHPRRRDTR